MLKNSTTARGAPFIYITTALQLRIELVSEIERLEGWIKEDQERSVAI
jgi:hypothetical protein